MKVEDFAAWLSAISGMSEDQRREAMVALEKASVVGGAADSFRQEGRQARPPGGRARNDRRRARGGSGVSPLRGPRNRRLGPLAWAFAVSLQELRAHLQYADQDADGASAQEGPLARSRARDDRGQEPGEDRGALRIHPTTAFRAFLGIGPRPLKDRERRFRPQRTNSSQVLGAYPSRADGPTCRERREGAAERPGILAFARTTFPSLSPATEQRRHLQTRSWPRSTALQVSLALAEIVTARAIISSAMAARRSPLSPVEPGLPSTPCRRRESRPPRRRASAHQQRQRLSRPSQAMAQPLQRRRPRLPIAGPRALRIAGSEAAKSSNRQAGSKALSETGHTNR